MSSASSIRKSLTRRRGTETSATRTRLIGAAAQLMLEEGYAAVTARRVASKADLKPQLVHYYFPTMDDLLVAVIRFGGDRHLAQLTRAVESVNPLQAMWSAAADPEMAVLSMQFLALATHRDAVRAEVRRYSEQVRRMQTAAFTHYLEEHGLAPTMPPVTAMLMTTSVSSILFVEQVLGITFGHAETQAFITDSLQRLEAAGSASKSAPAKKRKRTRKA